MLLAGTLSCQLCCSLFPMISACLSTDLDASPCRLSLGQTHSLSVHACMDNIRLAQANSACPMHNVCALLGILTNSTPIAAQEGFKSAESWQSKLEGIVLLFPLASLPFASLLVSSFLCSIPFCSLIPLWDCMMHAQLLCNNNATQSPATLSLLCCRCERQEHEGKNEGSGHCYPRRPRAVRAQRNLCQGGHH